MSCAASLLSGWCDKRKGQNSGSAKVEPLHSHFLVVPDLTPWLRAGERVSVLQYPDDSVARIKCTHVPLLDTEEIGWVVEPLTSRPGPATGRARNPVVMGEGHGGTVRRLFNGGYLCAVSLFDFSGCTMTPVVNGALGPSGAIIFWGPGGVLSSGVPVGYYLLGSQWGYYLLGPSGTIIFWGPSGVLSFGTGQNRCDVMTTM